MLPLFLRLPRHVCSPEHKPQFVCCQKISFIFLPLYLPHPLLSPAPRRAGEDNFIYRGLYLIHDEFLIF